LSQGGDDVAHDPLGLRTRGIGAATDAGLGESADSVSEPGPDHRRSDARERQSLYLFPGDWCASQFQPWLPVLGGCASGTGDRLQSDAGSVRAVLLVETAMEDARRLRTLHPLLLVGVSGNGSRHWQERRLSVELDQPDAAAVRRRRESVLQRVQQSIAAWAAGAAVDGQSILFALRRAGLRAVGVAQPGECGSASARLAREGPAGGFRGTG